MTQAGLLDKIMGAWAGQDSDCNPATDAGILCTMMGYDNIPDNWLDPIKQVEDRYFSYTTIEFSGIGIVIKGSIAGEPETKYTGEMEVSIDGEADRIMKLPADYRKRTDELYWNVQLPDGGHSAELRWLNPVEGLG